LSNHARGDCFSLLDYFFELWTLSDSSWTS